ncbi:hypothetical protein E5675_14310 [Sphingopyxis sp. PAMC25046]|uniref:hypothetical protein n=1 Tax=Sphingopyxis sp. PAMC25046 TaxID=2565556 RepID=UPI00109D9DDF|nr:hypothetical protein [Sphingopyxis sp. PAMC25046]QCB55483.1 hypothetical protein E5675_14310 [Sphingopyxis sp. PAMC25046]
MTKWHESAAANFGLRATGLSLLAVAWLVAVRLHQMFHTISPRDATPLVMLLSAILFLCASAGSALSFVGPGLWEPVEISERWRRLPLPGSEAAEAFDGIPSGTASRPEDGASSLTVAF